MFYKFQQNSYNQQIIYLIIKMGNQSTKGQKSKIIKKQSLLKHPILQYAQLIQQNNCEQLQISIAVPNQQIYEAWQNQIRKHRMPYLDSQVLFLPKSMVYEDNGLCGTGGQLKVRYSAPPLMLSDELQNRINIMQPFTQAEIWYILYIIVYAASELHTKNLFIGDIRPNNIFLFQDGELAISCCASFLEETPNYVKSLRNRERTFLAPQQITQMANHKINSKQSQQSQSFSIGMTLLGLMILHDQSELYFSQKGLFDIQKFKKDQQILSNCSIYSTELKKIVLALLKQPIEQRITALEVYKLIKPYQYKITNLEPFEMQMKYLNFQIQQKLDKVNFLDYNYISSALVEHSRILGQSYKKSKGNFFRSQSKNLTQDKLGKQIIHQRMDTNNQDLLIVHGNEYNRFLQPSNYQGSYQNLNANQKLMRPTQLKHSRDTSSFNEYKNQNKKIQKIPQDQRSLQEQTRNKNLVRDYKVGSRSVDIVNMNFNNSNQKQTKSNLQSKFNRNTESDSSYNNSEERDIMGSQKKALQRQINKISFSKKSQQYDQTNGTSTFNADFTNQFKVQNFSQKIKKNPGKLLQMGKLTKSIRNLTQINPHNQSNYQQMIRVIDQKVKMSKQMFPSKQ